MCIIQGIPLDSLLRGLALELTGLPLLELGRSLARGGGASADTGGRLDLSFGRVEIHFERLGRLCAGCWGFETPLGRAVVVMKSSRCGKEKEKVQIVRPNRGVGLKRWREREPLSACLIQDALLISCSHAASVTSV